MTVTQRKVVFLDRDGTINVDRGFVHRIEDWEFVPSATEALMLLRNAGFQLAVVTNQSGIGAKLYTASEVERLHAHMCQELEAVGLELDVVAFCPHSQDDNCDCRKPRVAMAQVVAAKLAHLIDYINVGTV